MARDFQNELENEKKLGLSVDELPSFDALANNVSAVGGDETLKKIANELTAPP